MGSITGVRVGTGIVRSIAGCSRTDGWSFVARSLANDSNTRSDADWYDSYDPSEMRSRDSSSL